MNDEFDTIAAKLVPMGMLGAQVTAVMRLDIADALRTAVAARTEACAVLVERWRAANHSQWAANDVIAEIRKLNEDKQ